MMRDRQSNFDSTIIATIIFLYSLLAENSSRKARVAERRLHVQSAGGNRKALVADGKTPVPDTRWQPAKRWVASRKARRGAYERK